MKKIVIMSDNHGWSEHIDMILEKEAGAAIYIHCGDHEGYDENLSNFWACRGNNDWSSELPSFTKFRCENKWIGVIHSNQFGYFNREDHMLEFMEEKEVDILCIGHTHVPSYFEENGKYIINPGSTALPRNGFPATYAVLELDGQKVNVTYKLFNGGSPELEEKVNNFVKG